MPLRRKIVAGIGVAAIGLPASIVAAGSVMTYAVTPPDSEAVTMAYNPVVTRNFEDPWAEYRITGKDPAAERECENREVYAVTRSGTGPEVSQYMAGLMDEQLRAMGGCALVLWRGANSSLESEARVIGEEIQELTSKDSPATILLFGLSSGGGAMVEIARHPKQLEIPSIDQIVVVMDSSPLSLAQTKQTIGGVSAEQLQDFFRQDLPDVITYNHAPIAISNGNGLTAMGKLDDQQAILDSWTTLKKTWPPIIWRELKYLAEHTADKQIDETVWYLAPNDPDIDVNKVIAELEETVTGSLHIRRIDGTFHAKSWEEYYYNRYYKDIISEILEHETGHSR